MIPATSRFPRPRPLAGDDADRARLEAELRRLTAIIDQAADAIVTKDRTGVITGWNHGAERLYGFSAEEAIGQSISLIIPPVREGEEVHLLTRALEGHATCQHETLRQRKDGSIVDVSLTVSPLHDADGRVEGAVVITREITEQKLLERQLTGLFENAPATIALRDLDGRYLRVNSMMSRLFRRPAEELIGQDPSSLYPDATTRERVRAEDAEILRTGEAQSNFYQLPLEDGELRDYQVIRYPVRDAAGEVNGFGSFALDVTEQRRSEQEREQALAQLAEAQQIAKVGSWTWDTATATITWSAEMYRIFGRSIDNEAVDLEQAFEHIHPDDRAAVEAACTRSIECGAPFDMDYRINTGDGPERIVHASGRYERTGLLSGTVQDVTTLRAVEHQARAAAEHLRHVLENAPVGMALVAPDGRWLQVNRAVCEIVGYTQDELLDLTFQDVTHPDDLDADLAQVQRLLDGEIPDYHMEKRYIHKAGHEVWIQLWVTLVRDEHGEPDYFIAQIQDITRERQAREALAESEHRFKSIAANVPGMVYRYRRQADGERSLSFVSSGARDVYGLEPDALIADPSLIFDRIHPDDRAGIETSLAESAAHGSRWEWQGRHVMQDGTVKHLRATSQPTPEPDGSTVWNGVITDETPMVAARQQESANARRLETVMENLAGSAVTIFDRDLRLESCEGPLFANRDMNQLIGRPLTETASPTTVSTVVPAMQRALAGQASTVATEADQEGRALSVRVAPYRDVDGKIVGVLVHWHDISEARQAERDRDAAMDRFRIAFERAPIGMAVVGGNGGFQRVNQAFCEITGHSEDELLRQAPFALILPDYVAEVKGAFAGLGLMEDSVTLEYQISHANGDARWVQARITLIRDASGAPLHALAQILDITERREHEERLQHLADHDSLTGLVNRRGFETQLAGHLARCQRYGSAGAVLMLDLDGFKRVNDMLGHAAGDELLVTCATALKDRLRESDVVARLGGDEFAVLLPVQDRDEAVSVARSLIATLRARTSELLDERTGPVTVSVGIAAFSEDALDSDEMLSRADLAMYEAKQSGKDRHAVFASSPVTT